MTTEFRIESNLDNVFNEMNDRKEAFLEAVGLYIKSEAQVRSAVLSGDLRRSIDYKIEADKDTVHIGVIPSLHGVDYGSHVEFGTSKMQAQPYLAPSVEQNMANLRSMAANAYGGQ